MSAAAAGASCRNARRKQALALKQAEKEAAERALQEKLERKRARENAPPKRRQFHNLPEDYLRAHAVQGRKFNTGYTGHSSKLALPSHEQSSSGHRQHHRSPSHQNLHSSSKHHPHYHQLLNFSDHTPTHRNRSASIMRLGVDQNKLTKSATASFPLALMHDSDQTHHNLMHANNKKPIEIQIPVPFADGIFITPATPIPSQSPNDQQQQRAAEAAEAAEAEDEFLNYPLERVCSVYRNKKLGFEDPTINFYDEEDERQRLKLQQHQLQQLENGEFYSGAVPNGQHHHTHWTDGLHHDDDEEAYRICDHIEVNSHFVQPNERRVSSQGVV